MIEYIITFSLAIFFSYLADKNYHKRILFYLFSSFAIAIPVILAGFRDETIGTDINTYIIHSFEQASNYNNLGDYVSDTNIDKIFAILMYISRNNSDNVAIPLLIISLFNILCTYIAIVKMRIYVSIPFCMTIFLFSFYNLSLNLMRQSMALSACLLSFVFLLRRYYYKFIIMFLLAFLCHSSSIFFLFPLLIWLLVDNKFHKLKSNKYTLLYVLFLPMIFLLYDTLLSGAVNIGIFSEKYLMYSTLEKHGGTNVSSIFVATYVILTIVIYTSFIRNRNKIFLYSFLITYGILIVGLLSNISIWAGRLSLYFQIIIVILYPLFIINVPKSKRNLYKTLYVALLIFYWWYVYINNNSGETYPYTSKILGI